MMLQGIIEREKQYFERKYPKLRENTGKLNACAE